MKTLFTKRAMRKRFSVPLENFADVKSAAHSVDPHANHLGFLLRTLNSLVMQIKISIFPSSKGKEDLKAGEDFFCCCFLFLTFLPREFEKEISSTFRLFNPCLLPAKKTCKQKSVFCASLLFFYANFCFALQRAQFIYGNDGNNNFSAAKDHSKARRGSRRSCGRFLRCNFGVNLSKASRNVLITCREYFNTFFSDPYPTAIKK
jgi:hypothetical protein